MALTSNVIGDIGEMEVSTRLMETGLFIVFLLGGKEDARGQISGICLN